MRTINPAPLASAVSPRRIKCPYPSVTQKRYVANSSMWGIGDFNND